MQENNCTLFPDSIGDWSWSHCCKAHDIAYELQVDKSQADVELYKCIAESGDTTIAVVMASVVFAGVYLFGRYFYNKNK